MDLSVLLHGYCVVSSNTVFMMIWGLIFFLVLVATTIAQSVLEYVKEKEDKNYLSVINWTLLFISLLFLSIFIFTKAMLKKYEVGYKKGLKQCKVIK